jgi:RHS repeat-associated protein
MQQWIDRTERVNHTQKVGFHPFVFTGKERDSETGYSYFGARYMDHELMTMWLSVDPMADKYPSISPYAYCAWNPVKLVDPDGTEPWYKLITGYNKNNSPNPPTATRKNPVTGIHVIFCL